MCSSPSPECAATVASFLYSCRLPIHHLAPRDTENANRILQLLGFPSFCGSPGPAENDTGSPSKLGPLHLPLTLSSSSTPCTHVPCSSPGCAPQDPSFYCLVPFPLLTICQEVSTPVFTKRIPFHLTKPRSGLLIHDILQAPRSLMILPTYLVRPVWLY